MTAYRWPHYVFFLTTLFPLYGLRLTVDPPYVQMFVNREANASISIFLVHAIFVMTAYRLPHYTLSSLERFLRFILAISIPLYGLVQMVDPSPQDNAVTVGWAAKASCTILLMLSIKTAYRYWSMQVQRKPNDNALLNSEQLKVLNALNTWWGTRLVIMAGGPGVGKTHFAKTHLSNAHRISSDDCVQYAARKHGLDYSEMFVKPPNGDQSPAHPKYGAVVKGWKEGIWAYKRVKDANDCARKAFKHRKAEAHMSIALKNACAFVAFFFTLVFIAALSVAFVTSSSLAFSFASSAHVASIYAYTVACFAHDCIVVDMTNLTSKDREGWLKEFKSANVKVVVTFAFDVNTDVEMYTKLTERRKEQQVPANVVREMHKKFERLTPTEGVRQIVIDNRPNQVELLR